MLARSLHNEAPRPLEEQEQELTPGRTPTERTGEVHHDEGPRTFVYLAECGRGIARRLAASEEYCNELAADDRHFR